MSFRFTLDNIQKNDAGVTGNDADLLLLKTTTDSAGTLADLVGQIPVGSFPSEVQNTNTDVSFSGDHYTYGTQTLFNDADHPWNVGDTATIGASPNQVVHFYVGTNDATNPDSGTATTFLDANFIILNGVTVIALNDVTDVSVSGATSGQILQYNGTNWVPATSFGVGNITSTNASYMIATSDPGTAAAATYNAASFSAITGGGAMTSPSTIPSTHVLYYNGLALIPGTDYTLASDGSSIEVNATAQGEFVTGSVLNLVTTTLS